MSRPTLNRFAQTSSVLSLRETVQGEARKAEGERAGWEKKHAAALRMLDDYIAGLGPEDQRLYTLEQLNIASHGNRHSFEPGEQQKRILGIIGTSEAPPPPSATLDELVMAGVTDHLEHVRKTAANAGELAQKLEATQEKLDGERNKRAAVEAVVEEARIEAEASAEELRQAQERNEYLEQVLGNGEVARRRERTKQRRTKVEGETGIYTVPSEGGEVFEIGWSDAEGKKRWRILSPDASIVEARELRAELSGKPHKEAREPVAA
jgi:hypothetical protein